MNGKRVTMKAMSGKDNLRGESSARRDAFVVLLTVSLAILAGMATNALEESLRLLQKTGSYHLNETIFAGLVGLAIAGTWYAWRRTREARRELRARQEAEVRLREHATVLQAITDKVQIRELQLRTRCRQLNEYNRELKRAKLAAEAAVKARSDTLAYMSHEIRTPMTAILGYADNLLDQTLTESDRTDAINTIRRSGQHLLQVVNVVLDLSKIEAGMMTVESTWTWPAQILAEVASLMQARAQIRGLKFQVEFAGPLPEVVRTDATRLRQILINLIGNAIKFTDCGCVRVVASVSDAVNTPAPVKDPRQNDPECARQIALADEIPDAETTSSDEPSSPASVTASGPFLQFDVIDTGPGMEAGQIAKLFRPFAQADLPGGRSFGGTGLGLAISQQFARLLGGDVRVLWSEVNRGTCFRATIATGPLAGVKMIRDPAAVQFEAGPSPGSSAGGDTIRLDGCSVLLAEDGPDNQRLISFILRKAGAAVEIAGNGAVAVELARQAEQTGRPFDLILMDMQMPVMDGYEATRELRRGGYCRPIVALTAHAMSSDREKCLAAGCDDYATKPIDRRALLEAVRRCSDSATRRSGSTGRPEVVASAKRPEVTTAIGGL